MTTQCACGTSASSAACTPMQCTQTQCGPCRPHETSPPPSLVAEMAAHTGCYVTCAVHESCLVPRVGVRRQGGTLEYPCSRRQLVDKAIFVAPLVKLAVMPYCPHSLSHYLATSASHADRPCLPVQLQGCNATMVDPVLGSWSLGKLPSPAPLATVWPACSKIEKDILSMLGAGPTWSSAQASCCSRSLTPSHPWP